MKSIIASVVLMLVTAPVWADGDATKGKKAFTKCKSCHTVTDEAGDIIVKGGRTGPNLFGVPNRIAGTLDGYKYSLDLATAGREGLIWNQENFAAFLANPSSFLKINLEDGGAKSRMTFRLKSGADDIYAYLVSIGPVAVRQSTETSE